MTDYTIFKLQILSFLQGYAMGAKQEELTLDAKIACKAAFSGIMYQCYNLDEILKNLK